MAERTSIEWTDVTWNPVTGCSKVSPGCAHCYAETISKRFAGTNAYPLFKPWTPENATHNLVLHPERLDQPLRWRRPRVVFVNSMSDLFHELVPDAFIEQVYRVMADASQHTFQVLTKRPERARDVVEKILDRAGESLRIGAPNVWLGVSIENARQTWRADVLREIPAVVRFISAEPLLGSLLEHGRPGRRPLGLDGIDWLIAGGESGPRHRPVQGCWIRELRDACAAAGVAFFFKQWGGRTPKAYGRKLDGRTHDAMPVYSKSGNNFSSR